MENVISDSNPRQSMPRSERIHIGIFGKRNTGKSTLINRLTNQSVSIISDIPGTTTDAVYKPMEIIGIGACVIIDTAGYDDEGILGNLRIDKTKEVIQKCDVGIIVCNDYFDEKDYAWYNSLKQFNIPVCIILNKIDLLGSQANDIHNKLSEKIKVDIINCSDKDDDSLLQIRNTLSGIISKKETKRFITEGLVYENDIVLLVMPQDKQAPNGRLILPQVQTIRELLDKKAIVISCVPDNLVLTLNSLSHSPKLIITDSQCFKLVYDKKPINSLITSFSVLFSKYKGDIDLFLNGIKVVDKLTENDKVLIAEACSHVPINEDIGRVKIPSLLRKKVGEKIKIDVVGGNDFPDDLSSYSLIIQCGGCMFNRQHMLNRLTKVKKQNIPITNYGILMAYFSDILNNITY